MASNSNEMQEHKRATAAVVLAPVRMQRITHLSSNEISAKPATMQLQSGGRTPERT